MSFFKTLLLAAIIVFSFLASLSFAQFDSEWFLLPTVGNIPPGRCSHSAIIRDATNEMIIFGGFSGGFGAYRSDVYRLSLENNVWRQLPSAPVDRCYHAAIYDPIKDRMLVFGGHYAIGNVSYPTNTLYELNLTNNEWRLLNTSGEKPSPRGFISAAFDSVGYCMIVYGGTYYGSNETYTLDLNALDWELLSVSGELPPETKLQAMAIDQSERTLIVFGGYIYQSDTYSNDTYFLDLNTNIWSKAEPIGEMPSERSHMASAYSDPLDRMFIFWGYNGQRLSDTWAYHPQTNQWTLLTPEGSPPQERLSSSAVIEHSQYFYSL